MAQNPDRYSRVAIILHWAIAATIVFQIVLGWRMGGENSASTYAVIQLPKSIGITILLHSLLRLDSRLTHRAPPPPAEMPKYERIASAITHIAFYMIMIGLPISGWVLVSAAKIDIPTLLYSTIPWPHIGFIADMQPEMKSAWEAWAANAHSALAWLTYILLALHIGAVIKHQWLDKQALLARMTGSGQAGLKEPRLWGALAIIVLIGIS
ncbi:cytochrome b, partial [uncultured Brevundimonas sp.]|uniref:cytochrome b n=1 Tax=uncultured Brevundimonas sp. TaxID=213418 RepID=UPI002633F72A